MAKTNEPGWDSTERDALYYPYIHIRSVDWLKRALLVFPHIARIVPRGFMPSDRSLLRGFEDAIGLWGKPLLRSANLQSSGVHRAQHELISLFASDVETQPEAMRKYTVDQYRSHIRRPSDEFLLHRDKPTYELVDFLEQTGLMWPATFESPSAFTAVHPRVGEAIMSTIALACALDEGFDVVTDEGRVYYQATQVKDIYHSLVRSRPAKPQTKSLKASDKKIFELIIFQQCNVSALGPDQLVELSKDREAIDTFRAALAAIAAKIPEMQDDAAFEDRLTAAVDGALQAWRNDRVNLSKVSKQIFGRELLKPTEGFIKALVEKFVPPLVGAGVGGAAGGDARGMLIGAAGGFIVALATHSANSWARASDQAKQSPYRYLTNLEEAGVSFTMTK